MIVVCLCSKCFGVAVFFVCDVPCRRCVCFNVVSDTARSIIASAVSKPEVAHVVYTNTTN